MMNLNISGKRVLISGSSKGIGRAIAESFIQEGARVFLTSRKLQDLKKIEREISTNFGINNVNSARCDFTDQNHVNQLASIVLEKWGGLDILIANVGDGRSLPDPITEKKHFDTVMRLNFDTAVNASRAFLPLIQASKGNIIFIASIAGVEAYGAPVDYSVAKSAVIAFSKNLARKMAGSGVRVNCIAPGNIYFEGGTWDEKMKDNPERVRQLIENSVPMNRFGKTEEIADACLFLSSERASFITGALLCIDGGQTVTLF